MNKLKIGLGTVIVGEVLYLYDKSNKRKFRQMEVKKWDNQLNRDGKIDRISQYRLDIKSREQQIKELETKELDVLVIGGGCNGSGVFLESASRGLKTGLIESHDFAGGSSSKSTKLIHGGLRYLAQAFEFSTQSVSDRYEKLQLVFEALEERSYFLENAYYMNSKLPIVVVCESLPEAIFNYTGCLMYHLLYQLNPLGLTSQSPFDSPSLLNRKQLVDDFPMLGDRFNWGVQFYDGQFDDTRMNLDILLTALQFNDTSMANYVEFRQFVKNDKGSIVGAKVYDKLLKREFSIRCKSVVNCTGCFSDQIRKLDNENSEDLIIPVEGTHLVFDKKLCNDKKALFIPKTDDGRVMFVIPWLNSTLMGTTETKYEQPVHDPVVNFKSQVEIQKSLNYIYPSLTPFDISQNLCSKWAGLRPLVKELDKDDNNKAGKTKNISRKHVIEKRENGLISLMGGKWTIQRKMAEETVDSVFQHLISIHHFIVIVNGKIDNERYQRSITKQLKLVGSFEQDHEFKYLPEKEQYISKFTKYVVDKYAIEHDVAEHLVVSYGKKLFEILDIMKEHKEFEKKLVPNNPNIHVLKAEIIYQIRKEMATKPQDCLLRRTRIGFLNSIDMLKILPDMVNLFSYEFKWDEEKVKQVYQQELNDIRKLEF